jgi:hypothetical protein
LREASFVDVREFDLAALGLLDQLPNFCLGLSELLFIALFFRLCRVRFHTRPACLSAAVSVLRCTRIPNCSSSRVNSVVAVNASSEAHAFNCSMCFCDSFGGAPLRGASDRLATPLSSHR